MSDGGHVVRELGAYVLGALEPAERREVESHVATCEPCRDELARLSGMPALLDRLVPEEATGDLTALPARVGPRLDDAAATSVTALRRSVRRWRAAAGAAALVAGVAGVALVIPAGSDPGPDLPAPVAAELRSVADDAGAVDGTASAYAWEWGTTIHLEVEHLPERARYVIWVIDAAGEAQTAGTWGPTTERAASVRGATALQRPEIVTIEVRDDDGAVVAAADLPSG